MENQSSSDFDLLIKAARNGDDAIVRECLILGIAINRKDKNGKTALSHAAFNGRLAIVAYLLSHGAMVDLKDNYGGTPLFWAVCGGHLAIVKRLTAHGADINAQDNDGCSPFIRAASGISKPAHVEIMKLFLHKGADVNQKDFHGCTALMNACMGGYVEIVKVLLENGADVNLKTPLGDSAITLACRAYKNDCPEIVRMLLKHKGNIHATDQNNMSLLHLAAQNGHTGIVALLLDQKIDINADSGIALRSACEKGHLNTVALLLKRGAEIDLTDAEGKTPLMAAVSLRHNEIALMLIDAGANVNAVTTRQSWGGDRSVLLFALGIEDFLHFERCRPPKIDIGLIALLLEKGADPKYENQAGITPLRLARQKKIRVIGLLKKYGAID